jgi:hypothetical protein
MIGLHQKADKTFFRHLPRNSNPDQQPICKVSLPRTSHKVAQKAEMKRLERNQVTKLVVKVP